MIKAKERPLVTDAKAQRRIIQQLRDALSDRKVAEEVARLTADWGIEEDLPKYLFREIMEASY